MRRMDAPSRAEAGRALARSGRRTVSIPPWWAAGASLVVVGWGANQFVALLGPYHRLLGITNLGDDLAVAVYALGLIPALIIAAAMFDRLRRRRLAAVALVLTAASSAIMIAAVTVGAAALLVGRVVAGAGTGVALSGLTGWTRELSRPPHEHGSDPHASARRIVVCLSAGFAGGPLVTSLLAEWAPGPLISPYLVQILATALVAPVLLRSHETFVGDSTQPRALRDRGRERQRGSWLAQALVAPWVFAAAMTSIAIVGRFAGEAPLDTGAIAAVTLLVGAAVQPVCRRLLPATGRLVAVVGLVFVGGGLFVASEVVDGGLRGAVCAAVLLGTGYGVCHLAGLQRTTPTGPAGASAVDTAAFYALAYLGLGAPVLIAWLAGSLGYGETLQGAAAAASLTAVSLLAAEAWWRAKTALTS